MTAPRSPPPAFRIVSPASPSTSALAVLSSSDYGPFVFTRVASREALLAVLAECACDLLLLDDSADTAELLESAAAGVAVLVLVGEAADAAAVLGWLARGAQDVLRAAELEAPSFPQRLRAAIERQRRERDARTAYATDQDTGLPHQQQLIEHMSQLLALREREPAPMAVLVLRIEGLASVAARLGREAASVLRRKVGVRLRAGVRASDVVASIGDDRYAVLLGSILAPADAERVGAKLLRALLDPLQVAGQDVAVAAALGIGQYPQDGGQPEALLRRAVGLAAAAPAQGRAGHANSV